MSLMQWRPLKDVSHLRQQMDHLFDDLMSFGRDFPSLPRLEDACWSPAIELRETDDEIVVRAQVPGIAAKDLDVRVTENAVSIAGEHREEKRTQEKGWIRSEFQYGCFQRLVPLPVPVQHEQVRSEFKDGILTLMLPKAQSDMQAAVRVNLDADGVARAAMTEGRQSETHLQDTMRTRTEAELKAPNGHSVQETARELTAEHRQHEEHLQDTMRTRAATGTSL